MLETQWKSQQMGDGMEARQQWITDARFTVSNNPLLAIPSQNSRWRLDVLQVTQEIDHEDSDNQSNPTHHSVVPSLSVHLHLNLPLDVADLVECGVLDSTDCCCLHDQSLV